MTKQKKQIPILAKIALAIVLGILSGYIFPNWLSTIFITFNGLFSNFLGFIVPLLILGLVAPSIADLGRGVGRLLLITAMMAYGFTLFSGFFTYFSCTLVFPYVLEPNNAEALEELSHSNIQPLFTIAMPPLMNVTSALITAFTLGLGMTLISGKTLKGMLDDFRDIIILVIKSIIIPLLPLYIFGVFLNISSTGEVIEIMSMFITIIIIMFVLMILLLLTQFFIAGIVAKRNPIKLLRNMLPCYFTALGTQSSAATIPITLRQTLKNDVNPKLADFVIPLCATIHLSGSTLKIVACAMAIMMTVGMPIELSSFTGFIMMLGIAMVAAPGVPGGAIMAAIGILQSMLGFDESSVALMIALYITMDGFGTACNVTGDGAIAVIINKIYKDKTLGN